MKIFYCTILFLLPVVLFANTVNGIVKDNKGNILPFASVLIKGTSKGTTANSKGNYAIQLDAGEYVLVCQHVGYSSVEKKVALHQLNETVDFVLDELRYNLKEAVVKSGGEDPAYSVIRKAIEKRAEHLNEIKKFTCKVYIKGQLQLRDFPKKFLGEKVDFEDGDTSKRKMIFLSESVSNYSVDGNKKKVEVVSTKVSGQSDGFGFGSPAMISFYENIVSMGTGLNPRGFISPISANAINYYKYKLEGTFFENGVMINHIKVIPRRKYEPLFNGYINITEDSWRIQGVQLALYKVNQMQLLDTLNIEQLYVPLKDIWIIKQQVIYSAGKFFTFDFFGNFLQVYDQFNIEPVFKNKFFDNTIIKYADSSNKKSLNYWDSIRPVPLLDNEVKDYIKKDSLEQLRKLPHYLDSLDKKRNKPSFTALFSTGYSYNSEKTKTFVSFDPLIALIGINYNAVEGRNSNFGFRIYKRFKDGESISINPNFRYGYQNYHFNANIGFNYSFGKKSPASLGISGGKKVFQLNNDNPIAEFNNTLSTYYWQHSHMKIYEAWFAKASYFGRLADGINGFANLQFQDRIPQVNTIDSLHGNVLAPNYATDIMASNFQRHQAFIATVGITWQPGAKYVELPERKFSLGSKYPLFSLSLTQGINGLLGSDINYTKWKASVNQSLNWKLGGRFVYKAEAGGFLNADKVFVQDYQHYLGNETVIASDYLNSFQLLPYYQYSNTENFYAALHAEYHLNGLISNKIPGFKKLNWFFVMGGNALLINHKQPYYEAFFSVENIFKIVRVDFVKGFHQDNVNTTGIRVALPLLK